MTTPIFKENGSVDVDLLRDETKRMAAEKKAKEERRAIQDHITLLNDIINERDWFHSFKNYADAHHLAYENGWNYKNRRLHVMKAYIPKGSKYYEGTFYGKASYASSKMMIVRPLGFWERLLLRWKSW